MTFTIIKYSLEEVEKREVRVVGELSAFGKIFYSPWHYSDYHGRAIYPGREDPLSRQTTRRHRYPKEKL